MLKKILNKILLSIKRKTLCEDIFLFLFLYKEGFKLFNIFLPFFKINQKKIVFCSFFGGGYSCNPKYLAEELLKQNVGCYLIWLIDFKKIKDVTQFPQKIKLIKYHSIQAFFELATAKIWIDNCRKFIYPVKRKGQYYFQTWHGNMPLKKIEKDAESTLPNYYIKAAKKDSFMVDYCISNGQYITNLYLRSFWFKGDVLEYGSPRNDILIRLEPEILKDLKEKLCLLNNKIILYAPTFKRNYTFETYKIDYEGIVNALTQKYGGDWICLVKLHPNLYYRFSELKIPDWVKNVSFYPDIQELMVIADIVISDYSSLIFDFMYTKKAAYIYATDYESYKEERDVYFSLEDAPFPIAESNEELIYNIQNFNHEEYTNNVNMFIQKFGEQEDGFACFKVVNKIKEVMRNN